MGFLLQSKLRLRLNPLNSLKLLNMRIGDMLCKKEIEALEKNGTWSLNTLPSRKKALGCKWVYLIKLKSDGTVTKLVLLYLETIKLKERTTLKHLN